MKGLEKLLGKTDAPQLMVPHLFKTEIPERGYPVCKEDPAGFLGDLNGAVVVGIALHQGDKAIGRQRFNPVISKIQVGGLGAVGNRVDSLQQKLFVQDFLFQLLPIEVELLTAFLEKSSCRKSCMPLIWMLQLLYCRVSSSMKMSKIL